eukprot:3941914-Rhodomonas_salina.2
MVLPGADPEAVCLLQGTVLRACYEMPGTDTAYVPTRLLRGTDVAYSAALSAYALAMRCPVLTQCVALQIHNQAQLDQCLLTGTNIGEAATH